MKFALFDNFGALNSRPVFAAFRSGLDALGWQHAAHDWSGDVAVIWSMVWAGRMRDNHRVWQHFRAQKRPVIVLEVGMLKRGHTWKMAVNGTGSYAYHGEGSDANRCNALGIHLHPWRSRGDAIVICTQRSDSEQWRGQPATTAWLQNLRETLRNYTDRRLVIRPHPRQRVPQVAGFELEPALPVPGTYDDFDLERGLDRAWAVINHNSGPGVLAAIQGIPVFVDRSSLAAPVGNLAFANIESPEQPDRQSWLCGICHTEWTIPEIATGWPIQRLLPGLQPG